MVDKDRRIFEMQSTIKDLREALLNDLISDNHILFIRNKIETESASGVTNVTSELCVVIYSPDYRVITLLSETF